MTKKALAVPVDEQQRQARPDQEHEDHQSRAARSLVGLPQLVVAGLYICHSLTCLEQESLGHFGLLHERLREEGLEGRDLFEGRLGLLNLRDCEV